MRDVGQICDGSISAGGNVSATKIEGSAKMAVERVVIPLAKRLSAMIARHIVTLA